MPLFATNEDLALRASADLPFLCPHEQIMAAGADGFFEANRTWTLRSLTVDFEGQGVVPGHLAQLTRDRPGARSPSQLFVIEAVGPYHLELRRQGQSARQGDPPAPLSGLSGVDFRVMTLGPQLANASEALDRRFGLSRRWAQGTQGASFPRSVRDAVVLLVLVRQNQAMSRSSPGQPDAFAEKASTFQAEFDELTSRFLVQSPETDHCEVRRGFGTRLSR